MPNFDDNTLDLGCFGCGGPMEDEHRGLVNNGLLEIAIGGHFGQNLPLICDHLAKPRKASWCVLCSDIDSEHIGSPVARLSGTASLSVANS